MTPGIVFESRDGFTYKSKEGKPELVYKIEHPVCETCVSYDKDFMSCNRLGQYVTGDFYCKYHDSP